MALLYQQNIDVRQGSTPYEPQFNILNTEIFPMEADCLDQSESPLTEFHQFSRFPTEIQLRILDLTQSPKTKRLVTVLVDEDPRVEEDSQSPSLQNSLYTESNDLGNVISGVRYRVILPHPPRGSILLQICRKSREIALRRYRIRLPMNPRNSKNNKYLYIDPENDTLYLDSFYVRPSTLVGFFHDLRAYDKQGSGLWNLAINSQSGDDLGFLRFIAPENLQPAEVRSFRQSLMTLEHLWFIHLLDKDNRYTGQPPTQPLTGLGSFSTYQRPVAHAMPLFPEASEFHLMPSDPRPLKPSDFELVRFYKLCAPMAGWLRWEFMETSFGMTEENGSLPQREISYVIAVDATGNHTVCSQEDHNPCGEHAVRSITSLENYLAREGHQAPSEVGSLEEIIEKGQEVSVAGFWVFPIDISPVGAQR
ncbi:unnamed protein product [Clonostachys rosea f. rosea IK726]|uniref:Uncharacterized protein n=1 Tax=Clonostachys rosea f. rosea IK726 TaxID=1349383 RepID=A0ACA9TYX4_BIOOC|nr:unnamed protein product [Clonostachys rosea f. rosea IK726]